LLQEHGINWMAYEPTVELVHTYEIATSHPLIGRKQQHTSTHHAGPLADPLLFEYVRGADQTG